MYASPMVLIFSRPCRAASASNALKTLVKQRDDAGRLHPFGERCEVDDVGEQDRHLLVGLGDHAGLALRADSAIAKQQDVEETLEWANASYRVADRRTGASGTPVSDTPVTLQNEGDADSSGITAGLRDDQSSSREDHQPEERDEPRDRRIGSEEEQRPDRRHEGPQAHGARGGASPSVHWSMNGSSVIIAAWLNGRRDSPSCGRTAPG